MCNASQDSKCIPDIFCFLRCCLEFDFMLADSARQKGTAFSPACDVYI